MGAAPELAGGRRQASYRIQASAFLTRALLHLQLSGAVCAPTGYACGCGVFPPTMFASAGAFMSNVGPRDGWSELRVEGALQPPLQLLSSGSKLL